MQTDSLRRAPSVARFGLAVAWETVRKPRPTDLTAIPASAEALTTAWLTKALCAEVPGAAVSSVEVQGGHDGSTSRRKVRVMYNAEGVAAGLPEHLFTKSVPGFRQRLTLVPSGKLAAETGFYNAIRPQLDIEATDALYADFDPRTGRSMQVFEDLTETRGATFLNPLTYIDKSKAEGIVRVIAGYQGPLWQHKSLQRLRWLKTTLEWQETVNHVIAFEACANTGFERARQVLPVELLGREGELWKVHMHSLELSARPPHTMLHNDTHIGNWYVTADGQMGLSDWGMFKGQWANDFSYAISSALTVEDRRSWERDLVEYYLDRLHEEGGPAVPFDEAWLAYRQQMMHGLYYWLMTIGVGPLQADMQPNEFSMVNIERMARAVVDLDTVDALRT
jgi:hypothetical protein